MKNGRATSTRRSWNWERPYACPGIRSAWCAQSRKTARPRMVNREIGCALCVRQAASGSDVKVWLEQRPTTVSVMPGLWELPPLRETPDENARITVRHAIMTVNYVVRVSDVREEDLAKLTVRCGEGQWIPLRGAVGMALTGLARKVLKRVVAGSISFLA